MCVVLPIPKEHEHLFQTGFVDENIVPVKLDRIDEVEISMMTRKGNLINFVDHHDVKCQLEFKQIL